MQGYHLQTRARSPAPEKLVHLHGSDQRKFDKAPLFIFFMRRAGKWEVSTNAGKVPFDTAQPFWGSFGSYFNYSEIQRRVIASYERIRERKTAQ